MQHLESKVIFQDKKILMIGCGQLGQRVADRVIGNGASLTVAKRSDTGVPEKAEYISVDVTDSASLDVIAERTWDAVIIILTAPSLKNYTEVYVDGTANLITALSAVAAPPEHRPLLLFTSSTSVYAQDDDCIVDEESIADARTISGQTMLATERLLESSAFPSSSIRFVGLYDGMSSSHLHKQLENGSIVAEEPIRYSNRIHLDDAADVYVHLLSRYFTGLSIQPMYIASDGHPAILRELMLWLADQNAIDPSTLTEDYQPKRGGAKKVIGKYLQQEGFAPKFPSYKLGYGSVDS